MEVIDSHNKVDVHNKIFKINSILNNEYKDKQPGFMGGNAGVALFYFYYAKYINKQEPYDKGLELLTSIFESISKGFSFHTHASGIAGIGSLIEILVKQDFFEADTDEMLEGLDSFLYNQMISEIKTGNYDFLHGALGVAFYFLQRSNNNSQKYLIELIDELDKIAIKDEEGVRWSSELDIEKHTKGINLSLSHGLASIIVVLSKIYKQGIQKKKTLDLLEGSVKYLLNQQLDSSKFYSTFPSWVDEDDSLSNSRLAWCYGDLGIGIALYVAGNYAAKEQWKNTAIEILLRTTHRKEVAESGVIDAGMCHGAAGNAHIYNRMYKYTGISEFKDAASFWFGKTLEMDIHKDTFSGYKAYRSEEYGGPYEDFGFLEGIAGIGLSLISAISDIEPSWDECLLLS